MKVAVIDDSKEMLECVETYLRRYIKETKTIVSYGIFENVVSFVNSYASDYDVIFMDINMPTMNGIDAAKWLRKIDDKVCIVFLTNFSKYAINGYEVSAFDYILKPIVYEKFKMVLDKALKHMERFGNVEYLIRSDGNVVKLLTDDIYYIETEKHDLCFHTSRGVFRKRDALFNVEKELKEYGFYRITSSYLINLKYVYEVGKTSVNVNGESLPLSRLRKDDFMRVLNLYIGRAGV